MRIPNWFNSKIEVNMLEDETNFVKMGNVDEQQYISFDVEKPEISAWTNHPKQYKFTSLEVNRSYNQQLTNRETYDFLEYASDLGGLMESLIFAGYLIMAPVISFALSSEISSIIFMVKPLKDKKLERDEDGNPIDPTKVSYNNQIADIMYASKDQTFENIKHNLNNLESLKSMSFYKRWFKCESKHAKLLRKAGNKLDKELDLKKFVVRQRILLNAVQGLLLGR